MRGFFRIHFGSMIFTGGEKEQQERNESQFGSAYEVFRNLHKVEKPDLSGPVSIVCLFRPGPSGTVGYGSGWSGKNRPLRTNNAQTIVCYGFGHSSFHIIRDSELGMLLQQWGITLLVFGRDIHKVHSFLCGKLHFGHDLSNI